MTATVLRRGEGRISGQEYLPCDPVRVLWGWLPSADDPPALTVSPGGTVTIDTLSHEGILEDQGRDPLGFFARYGVPAELVLEEAVDLAGSVYFERFSFVKTTVGAVLVALFVVLFVAYVIKPILPEKMGMSKPGFIQVYDDQGQQYIYTYSLRLVHFLTFLARYIWVPLFWSVAFFRLKEKEI